MLSRQGTKTLLVEPNRVVPSMAYQLISGTPVTGVSGVLPGWNPVHYCKTVTSRSLNNKGVYNLFVHHLFLLLISRKYTINNSKMSLLRNKTMVNYCFMMVTMKYNPGIILNCCFLFIRKDQKRRKRIFLGYALSCLTCNTYNAASHSHTYYYIIFKQL